jgi:hypothetical protein
MEKGLKAELKAWRNNILSPYCLNSCKHSCCDCSIEGEIPIDRGFEHLFKTFKTTGKKVHFSNKTLKAGKPHLYWFDKDNLCFTGGLCPNYNPETKKCLIHNQHPMCALFPLEKTSEGYGIISACELYHMDWSQEPLKSLTEIFKKHGVKLMR